MSSTPPKFNVDIRKGQIWKELRILQVNNPVHDGLVKDQPLVYSMANLNHI